MFIERDKNNGTRMGFFDGFGFPMVFCGYKRNLRISMAAISPNNHRKPLCCKALRRFASGRYAYIESQRTDTHQADRVFLYCTGKTDLTH